MFNYNLVLRSQSILLLIFFQFKYVVLEPNRANTTWTLNVKVVSTFCRAIDAEHNQHGGSIDQNKLSTITCNQPVLTSRSVQLLGAYSFALTIS